MKCFSRLSRRLTGNRLKWFLLPFAYLLYASLIFSLGISVFFFFLEIFSVGLDVKEYSAIIAAIIISLCWLIILVYASYKSMLRHLRWLIAFPAIMSFAVFLTYLIIHSLEFFVDFTAYLLLIYLPVICLFSILILLVYDLTPKLFGMVYLKTQSFAEPKFSNTSI